MADQQEKDKRGDIKKRLHRMIAKMNDEDLLAWEEHGKNILRERKGVKRRVPNPSGTRSPFIAKMHPDLSV